MKSADGNSGSSLVGICLYCNVTSPCCQVNSIKYANIANIFLELSGILPGKPVGQPGALVTEVQENSGGETKSVPGVAGEAPSVGRRAPAPPRRPLGRHPPGCGIPGGSSLCRECCCACHHEPAYTFLPGRGNPGSASTQPRVPISRRKGMSAHREGKELPGAYRTPGRRRCTGTGEVHRRRLEWTAGNAGDGSAG